MPVDQLINIPLRTQPQEVFSGNADGLWGQLNTFATQTNAAGADVTARQVDVTARQADVTARQADVVALLSATTTQANNAANSASAAAATANAAAWVSGNSYAINVSAISQIDFLAYRKKTASSVTVIDPKNDSINWVTLNSAPGVPLSPRAINIILGSADKGKLINITSGTFTQTFEPAATLGSDWWCYISNVGAGNITLDPNGGELINGLTTKRLRAGTSAIVQCDGSGFTMLPVSDMDVGDTLTTLNTLSAPDWLVAGTYAQASYPALFAKIGAAPDGTTVSQRTLPATEGWRSIAFGNGVFAGAAYSGTLTAAFSSTDGIKWAARTMPVAANWTSCAFGNGVFVMVSMNSTIAATSANGINWTERALPTGNAWQNVVFGNGLFIATATGAAVASTSADGISWTNRTLPVSGGWTKLAFGNGVWVALLNTAGTVYATSTDGFTWTQRAFPVSITPTGIAFGNGIFVIVTSTTEVLTSLDGINWTQRTGVIPSPSALVFGAGVFFALAGGASARSVDGITWTSTGSGGGSHSFYQMAFGAGLFASPGNSTAVVTTFPPYTYDYTTLFKVPGLNSTAPFVTYMKGQ